MNNYKIEKNYYHKNYYDISWTLSYKGKRVLHYMKSHNCLKSIKQIFFIDNKIKVKFKTTENILNLVLVFKI